MKYLKRFLEISPALAFFIGFRINYSIVDASTYLVITSVVSSVIILLLGKFTRINALILFAALAFGLPTILLNNPNIIKLKATVVNYTLATIVLVSTFYFKKNLISMFMYKKHKIKAEVLDRVSLMWGIFWYFVGTVNFIVAFLLPYIFNITQQMADEIWVDFRTFSPPILNTSFMLYTIYYIFKHRN